MHRYTVQLLLKSRAISFLQTRRCAKRKRIHSASTAIDVPSSSVRCKCCSCAEGSIQPLVWCKACVAVCLLGDVAPQACHMRGATMACIST